MINYVIKRLLWMIPVILCVAIGIFTLMYFVPGDPATIILGSDATELEIFEKREAMGLNEPYIVQLKDFLYSAFIKFDFGSSYITNVDIAKEIMTRLPRTLTIGIVTLILSLSIGVPLGIIAAVNQNKAGDRISMFVALFGVSMPQFWFGLMLVILFSYRLNLLPAYGIGTWKNYVLPCIAGSMGGIATQARQSRSSMLEVIRADYITTARAKGISKNKVIIKHALPNALLPVMTVAGTSFAHIFGGSVVLETVFSIPGVGSYLISAVNSRDYPVVRACVIFLAIVFGIVMLLLDIIYAFVDPRIKARYEKAGAKGGT